jgi:cysteine synthase A
MPNSNLPAVVEQRLLALTRLVGATPLLVLDLRFRGTPRRLYAKAESFNWTGSIKDRMALHVLRRGYEDGSLAPGAHVFEATSGNTGISFCAVGRCLGHPVTIFMPDWMSQERVALIESLGATIVPVSRAQGGFLGSIRLAEERAADCPSAFLPRQFSNLANVEAHEQTTGPEIWAQLDSLGLRPDAFVAGVGTGGTVMGVGRYLRTRHPGVRVHPMEPAESPTLRTGHKVGQHRIQGVSDEFVPPVVQLQELDAIVDVADGDAILMAQRLASELGLGVGISSGANFLAALRVQTDLDPSAVVVTVFPDSNKKYLSTDLLRSEPSRPDYLSPDVELLGFDCVGRAPC